MKQRISEKTAKGKVIADIIHSFPGTQTIINFTDNTYFVFCVSQAYYEDRASIGTEDLDFNVFAHTALVEAGICTNEELATMKEKEEESCKEHELQQYACLKKKYNL